MVKISLRQISIGEAATFASVTVPEFSAYKQTTTRIQRPFSVSSSNQQASTVSVLAKMAAKFPEEPAAEDFLNCLICTEPYENPKVLPCHHTFCSGCLDRYFSTVQSEGTQEPGTLPCPVCRRVVSVPDDGVTGLNKDGNLPQHKAPPAEPIQDMVGKFEKTPLKKLYCDVCKYRKQEILAKDHCASCGINYCEQCSRDHSKHCLFRNHSTVPVTQIENSSLRCEAHDAETVKYYCFTCMVPLCTVCAVTEHQKHETSELHSALGDKKEQVMNGISGMSEQVASLEEFLCELEDLQSLKEASMKKTKLEIDRHVNNLIGQLHMRKHAIMEDLDKLHNSAMKQIAIEKENGAFQLANLKSLWKFGAKLTEPAQSLQLLAMHTDIMIMIESTKNKPQPQVPKECALMNMFMPKPDLSVGTFQKCELSSDVVAKAPGGSPGMTNGHHNGVMASPRIPKSSSLSSLSRPMSAPPTFFKDPFKEQPSLKWLVSPKIVWKINKIGPKVGEICETYDVTMLPDGCTVVAEWMNQRLQIFDDKGQSVSIIGADTIQPWGLTITREGNIAVTDDKERSVKIMDPTGHIITSWKKNMYGWPRGISENSLGQFIVSDTEHGKHTVSIHLPDGRCVRKFGSQGTGNNQFHWPRYVTVDHDDRIIVSDGSNHCIKVFDPSGQFLHKFGGLGNTDGTMKHPRGVCVDPQNNIIVADQDNNRVTMFSPDGKFLRHLLAISKPWGVCVSDNGLLAVTQKPALKIFKIFDAIKN